MKLFYLQNIDVSTSHTPCNICVKENHSITTMILCMVFNKCKLKHSSNAEKVKEEPKYLKYNSGLLEILQIK